MADNGSASEPQGDELWRGVDLSGISLVVGVGGGRLVQILGRQVAALGGGQVVAMDYGLDALRQLGPLLDELPVSRLNARLRQIPVMDETVDLLVMNGTIRQVPSAYLVTMCEEMWRVMVPGGQLRIADMIEPSEAPYNEAWRVRNGLIATLGEALNQPTALYVGLRDLAAALTEVGFESLAVSILPGLPLTEAWLEATQQAVQAMASRVVDPDVRQRVIGPGLARLQVAFRQGEQRAAERFALRGSKIGGLALDMEASFTEEDLVDDDDA